MCPCYKKFITDFLKDVKSIHGCFVDVRTPSFKHGLIPTDKNIQSKAVQYAIQSGILEHICLKAYGTTCTIDFIRKNTLIASMLVTFLFVQSGPMLFNLSVYFKYTCLAHHPDINYSNALREGRTILAFYESNTREFQYPSMEKLLCFDKDCAYFCNMRVNFNGVSMPFCPNFSTFCEKKFGLYYPLKKMCSSVYT